MLWMAEISACSWISLIFVYACTSILAHSYIFLTTLIQPSLALVNFAPKHVTVAGRGWHGMPFVTKKKQAYTMSCKTAKRCVKLQGIV